MGSPVKDVELKRYSVAVEHDVIIYAESSEEAEKLALDLSGRTVPTWPAKVVDVLQIPPIGETGSA